MNQNERNEYSALYKSKIKVFERKYAKAVNALLKKQFSRYANILKVRGLSVAMQQVRLLAFEPELHKLLLTLYKDVGIYFAKWQTLQIKREASKGGQLGQNDQWIADIIQAFQEHIFNRAILRINDTTRDRILEILSEGEQQGLSVDEMATQLESDEITLARAKTIARTETGKAANVGRELAVKDITFQLSKEWITAGDERVRIAHAAVDGTIIDEDEDFIVDGENMNAPSDPEASPENIINCRCTCAYVPKRSAGGRLIPKN